METGKRILFVEDDVLISRIYGSKLKEAGYEVAMAGDGLVAMKLLQETLPDLVVLDLIIPKLSGVDVLKLIRSRPELKHTRVVVFSNGFLQNLWEETAALGVQEMVLKSRSTPPQLLETISRVLKRPVTAPAPAGSGSNVPAAGVTVALPPRCALKVVVSSARST
jgi:CheY-like chemotaxis protein